MVNLYAEAFEAVRDRGSRTRGGLEDICNNKELCNYVAACTAWSKSLLLYTLKVLLEYDSSHRIL